MKAVAGALLVLGTIVGTLGGSKLPTADVPLSAAGLVMLLVGTVLLRLGARSSPSSAALGQGDLESVRGHLVGLVDQIEQTARDASRLDLATLVDRISQIERDHLRPLDEQLPALLPVLGDRSYAELMGPFAMGEILIRRAWSAAADHHEGETRRALQEGAMRLRQSLDRFEASLDGIEISALDLSTRDPADTVG